MTQKLSAADRLDRWGTDARATLEIDERGHIHLRKNKCRFGHGRPLRLFFERHGALIKSRIWYLISLRDGPAGCSHLAGGGPGPPLQSRSPKCSGTPINLA